MRLPLKELQLVALLARHRPRAVPLDDIIAELWPHDEPKDARRAAYIHVCNARRKLRALSAELANEAAVGYRLKVAA